MATLICPHCADPLRYDRVSNALYCLDCDYIAYLRLPPKRTKTRPGRIRKSGVKAGVDKPVAIC